LPSTAEHRQVLEDLGLLRVRRVGHVEDDDADAAAVQVEGVGREQQRGVVVRALVPGGVDVAHDLEPARGPLVREHRDVAPQAVGRRARGNAPLDARLGLGPRAALRTRHRLHRWRRRLLHGDGGRRLPRPLPEREQVVQRVGRQLRADDGGEQPQRENGQQGEASISANPVH
jgi:hypothetical protein